MVFWLGHVTRPKITLFSTAKSYAKVGDADKFITSSACALNVPELVSDHLRVHLLKWRYSEAGQTWQDPSSNNGLMPPQRHVNTARTNLSEQFELRVPVDVSVC